MLLDSWEYVDDVDPVRRRISGAAFGVLWLLIDSLKKRGNAGSGIERCEVSGSGLLCALQMNSPAVEC